MSQILIPLGGLAFLALLFFAFVREVRKQRSAARRGFEELARRRGWAFDPVDDGGVAFAEASAIAVPSAQAASGSSGTSEASLR